MQTRLLLQPLPEIESEALIVLGFDRDSPRDSEFYQALNAATQGWLEEVYQSGEFQGKKLASDRLETALLHRPPGLKARRLLLAGCGARAGFDAAQLRKVSGAVVRAVKRLAAREVALALDPAFAADEFLSAAAEGAILGAFEPDRYKTQDKPEPAVETFAVAVSAAAPATLEAALERGRIVAESQNFTRDLVTEPANRLTPTALAERARQMAAEQGLECEVLDPDRMAQLGMGALLGVARGSSEPPALIIVGYRPRQPASTVHLGLVGKGVTFDTGGISIKPAEGMEKMKYDMAGGAAVLGAMRALAQLRPGIAVTALVPAVENMPGSRAQRPGDIVTSLSGKTIEVLNTDAEGRLILVDALAYARRLGCTHLVDAATLTGAIVIALGHVNVGVFSNNEALLGKVLGAAKSAGEKMWPMPLDDDYKDSLQSAFADLPNIGNRWGGAITAAMFLKEFVEDTPWVHLDIAGTAWLDDPKAFLAKGPTGIPVRTFVNLAMNL